MGEGVCKYLDRGIFVGGKVMVEEVKVGLGVGYWCITLGIRYQGGEGGGEVEEEENKEGRVKRMTGEILLEGGTEEEEEKEEEEVN